jgi:hypothetical protein
MKKYRELNSEFAEPNIENVARQRLDIQRKIKGKLRL